jgi:hypothetical protein
MIFVYVDDVLILSHQLKVLIDAIGEYYKVKPESDKEPKIYLGANIEKKCSCWSVAKYGPAHLVIMHVKNAIKTIESFLRKMVKGTY